MNQEPALITFGQTGSCILGIKVANCCQEVLNPIGPYLFTALDFGADLADLYNFFRGCEELTVKSERSRIVENAINKSFQLLHTEGMQVMIKH